MVCKKYQVYDWFRTLDGAKRIDFLNGMLHLCFPLELRFLGSCIEELARKDYSYLRDAEIKANAASEIQLMRDIGDKVTRSKMIVTLALLASGNYECARYLYDLLNVDIMELLEKMKSCLDEKIADEFLLLLTMAANHPAFDFQMKTKMSQLYLNAEYKLKQNKILLKESESDLNLCNRAENDTATDHVQPLNDHQSTDKSSSNICHNPDLLLLKSTLNDIKNNINNTCKSATTNEINNNLNKKKNRNKVEPAEVESLFNSLDIKDAKKNNEVVAGSKTNQKNENENDELPEEEKLNDSLIESINFEGVQTIKGTECYKFIIKIQWSDKTFNEIDKTYSELCEFNKQLINLYPKELSGLMENSQLVLKENQKEDFVKELPLVTDYCSKIANLPKVVCESDFLRSFFRSNLSNSSITIANDSNSPNRQILTNSSNKASPTKQLTNSTEKKVKSVVKKLDVQDADKSEDPKVLNTQKSEIPADTQKKPAQNQTKPSLSEQSENSTSISSAANESQASEAKSNEPESTKKTMNNNIKTKNNAATVSVAGIMNTNETQKQNKTNQKGNERIHSNDSSIRQNSMPPTINHQQQPPPLPPNAQLLNYPPTIYNPNQMPPLNAQYPPGNYNQPLHLHTFQPINNMIIGSPPCASPTTTTNPHSLNSSRSNSPWMMMPPPMPPVQQNHPPTQQGNIPNNSQQFYHQAQYQHPQGMHQNVRSMSSSKNNSTSNLKDQKHTHFNNYYNSQDELLLRYALDNNNSHYNSNPNLQPPSGHSVEESSHLNYSTLSLNERHNSGSRLGKMTENNLRKNSSKSKNVQHPNTSESLLTTALTNTNNQYNNANHSNSNTNADSSTSTAQGNTATAVYNGISSGSSSGAMSPKPVNDTNANSNPTTSNANPTVRSSSSCSSSSYHQTPPPAQPGQAPPALINNVQHVQPNQSQASPSQHQNAHAAAIAAYNATLQQIAVAYQSQKLDQWGNPNPHTGNPPPIMPNHHLIPMTSSQIAALQQQQQQQQLQHQPAGPNGPNNPHGSMPSLLLAPLMNSPNQNYIPVGYPAPSYPPPSHGQHSSNQKFSSSSSSKQPFKNVSVPPQERSNTPSNQQPNYLVTSDDETIETGSQNGGSKSNNLPENRAHRKSIPNIANFPAKYMNRQHKSHSISLANPSTATSSSSTIQSSSGTSLKNSNQGSTNTLSNVQNSNNSSSVSPQNSSIKKSTENITHSAHSPSQVNSLDTASKKPASLTSDTSNKMASPKTQSKRSNRLTPTKEQPTEGSISVELTAQTEPAKDSANIASNNGPFSSSSTSSSSSSISNNTQSKSPKSAAPQPQQQQQNQAPVTQNGNLYYSSVVSNYPYIEGQNTYALQNGSTAPNSNSTQNTSLPPPPLTSHHNTIPPQFNNFSHPQPPPQGVQHQNAHPGYYNAVPIQPQQQQNYQATNGTSANTSANCATPTPGSSPNTISNMPQQTAQPSSSANFNSNYNTHGSQQHSSSNSQHPQIISTQQPPPYIPNSQTMDPHHSMNPYNLHHMMALVANNQQPPMNGVPMQPMNPNMVMMMMMNPPPGHLPPGQLPPGQIVNSKHQYSNYQQFQPYRSITPTTLHQQQNSPSMGNNLLNFYQQQQHNSRKKLSCYNCGSMNHSASECKEPTLESISQPTQFRLNFKVNNNQMSSTGPTNLTAPLNQTNDSDELNKNENNNLTVPTSYSKKTSAKNSISPNNNPTLLTSSNFK